MKKKATKKTTKKAGRKPASPGTATPALIERVLGSVSAGASLRTAAEQNGIAVSTALRAIELHGMAEQYARAREERADVLAEEMIEIADVGTGDAARDRLRLDARKWFASKLYPRKYGDKVAIGGDADAPPVAVDNVITIVPVRTVSGS